MDACIFCKATQQLEQFATREGTVHVRCHDCAIRKIPPKEWRTALNKAINKICYRASREKRLLQMRARARGTTPQAILDLERKQGGACAICGSQRPRKGTSALCLDHHHASGQVRGLLCHPCNQLLGWCKDDSGILRAAIAYLEKHTKAIGANG